MLTTWVLADSLYVSDQLILTAKFCDPDSVKLPLFPVAIDTPYCVGSRH